MPSQNWRSTKICQSPTGEQERAREHIREYVEREREWLDRQPRLEPDHELLAQREQFRKQAAARITDELGLLEEYEALQDPEQGQVSVGSESEAPDVDGTEDEDE